jgi:hypothetical protein
MKWDTKVLIWCCGAMALAALAVGDYPALSGFATATIGWLVVGLKERREVK